MNDATQPLDNVISSDIQIKKRLLCIYANQRALCKRPSASSFHPPSFTPFSYLDDDRLNGFSIDIIQAMMEYTQPTLKCPPFNRAFQLLKSQPNTALFVIAKRPEREVNMKWAGPIISSGVYFYQKRNSGLSLADLEDLKRVRNVGAVLG